jgi:hypothetical protein
MTRQTLPWILLLFLVVAILAVLVASRSVSIAVRAAHLNYRRQSHTRTAKAPDNQAPAARDGLTILCPSRSHANADSAKASVVTPATMSNRLGVEFARSVARSSIAVRYL